jgi:hypothetical protein
MTETKTNDINATDENLLLAESRKNHVVKLINKTIDKGCWKDIKMSGNYLDTFKINY